MSKIPTSGGPLSLSPIAVFVAVFVGLSLLRADFYAVPVTVAFLIASAYAICIVPAKGLDRKLEVFSSGVMKSDVLLIVWLLIMAGAFSAAAKSIGAVQATVDLCLTIMPAQYIVGSLFLASCLISLAMGTSMGTIAALVPITTGIATQTTVPLPLMVGAVVGGSFFGDNLSFISDTTIVATRSQGCAMADKFRTNIRIALPAAALVLALYIFKGIGTEVHAPETHIDWLLVAPYAAVLVLAICGINVVAVLSIGIASTAAVGTLRGFDFFAWLAAMNDGINGMAETIYVALLASALIGTVAHMGGINYLLSLLRRRIKGRRGAELSLAAMSLFVDTCTANNTVALITIGPLARQVSNTYGVSPRRTASLIDIFTSVAQGLMPYGGQVLLACALAALSPVDVVPMLFYPVALGLCALVTIIAPQRHTRCTD